MHWYEPDVRALEEEQRRSPAPPGSVVFYGSSSIRLWSTLRDDFPGVPVVNRGFGGSTMAACSWFFWRLVHPLAPRALVLYAGDNDIGDGESPTEIVKQLGFLVTQLDESAGAIPLTFITIKPSVARFHLLDRILETNRLAAELLAARPRSYVIDVVEPMLEHGRPRPELYEPDGLHLSRAGYLLWRDLLQARRPEIFAEADHAAQPP
ncbi:GDSL-type esterase/lipase family protein [Sorangium sp. So ce726]|uniref:GDSL-type esterase/lipase family protein n=1 Tax=Sorangium sp. So ce726 TaxID=3133319 RepID=UPI003F61726C